MQMIQHGGRWSKKNGEYAGNGAFYHFKQIISYLWPFIEWHKWNEMFVENYLSHRTVVAIGPASSGKTNSASLCLLTDYYCFSGITTGIVCSTTRERLEDRVWGEIKRLHKEALRICNWLPGNIIEGRQRLVTDDRQESEEGRDFRNGIVGVPCKRGENYVGLGDFAGLKNKRVRLLGDELHLLPRVFVDAISNLDKNPDFKAVGLGNPKDITDALGILAEPAPDIGGWDSGIDQNPVTKTWKTRRPDGVCIQFVGTDSPNLNGQMKAPLITQAMIDRDVAFYGKDSVWFSMMDQGMMPKGGTGKRVLTRQFCLRHRAMEEVIWADSNRTKIAFLDAAYRGIGGDRCVFGWLEFGREASFQDLKQAGGNQSVIEQRVNVPDRKLVLALMETFVVPIQTGTDISPEDQIVAFVRSQCETRLIQPQNFFYDSGMRTSLVSAFSRLWSNLTNPIDCGGEPSDRKVADNLDVLCKDYYSKRITEFWWSVRWIIETEQFRNMTEDVMNEGCQREWGMVGNNKIEIEPKEKMKLKTGRSPDLFDALAIGVEGARQRGFLIHRLKPEVDVEKEKQDNKWLRDLEQQSRELNAASTLSYTV